MELSESYKAFLAIAITILSVSCAEPPAPNAHWHRVNKLNWNEYSDQPWQFEADSGDIVCDQNPKYGTVVYFYPLDGNDDAIPLNDGAVRLDAELGKPMPIDTVLIDDGFCLSEQKN